MQYLLERLASTEPDAKPQMATGEAIREQIARVLNSHLHAGIAGLDLMQVDLPHLGGDAYASARDVATYAGKIGRLISLHEPRLQRPKVTLAPRPEEPTRYQIVITGFISSDDEDEAFEYSFDPRR